MTRPGVLRALAAVAAVALACVAGLRAHADAAYRRGLGYTDRPAEDVPGRLEAYELALERSPRCFTYLLRSGQIHLARVGSGRDPDGAHLRSAGQRLREAVAVHPLDARAQVALAQLLLAEGDAEEALGAAVRAVRLGPRHPSVQSAAVRAAVSVWARTGRIDALGTALDLEVARTVWQPDAPLPRGLARMLAARSDRATGDVLEACAGDPARLSAAHAWAVRALPDLAPVLEAVRRSGERR